MSKREEWPEIGELVIGTVTNIVPYGAYISLDEYGGREGLLHISEISSSWVRNIRRHVTEGQKVVLQVLRVDKQKRHIDFSLRRVTERDKKEKLLEWKRSKRGITLFKTAAEEIGIDPEEAYEKIGVKLEERFGTIYQALVEAAEKGEKILLKADIPEKWARALVEIAKSKITPPVVKVKGVLKLRSIGSDGVEVLRKAFKKAVSAKKRRNGEVKIYVLGAPRYRVEVTSRDYKTAEKIMADVVEAAISYVKSSGGEGSFERE